MTLTLETSLMLLLLSNCSIFALVMRAKIIPVVIILLVPVACAERMNSQVLFPALWTAAGWMVRPSRHRIVKDFCPIHNVSVHFKVTTWMLAMTLTFSPSLMLLLLNPCSVFALVMMMEMIILVVLIPVVIIPVVPVARAQQMNSQILFPALWTAAGWMVRPSRHRIVKDFCPIHNVSVQFKLRKV